MGKQVLLYLVDGRRGGLQTAEIENWTGHLVAVPRSDHGALFARDEPRRTGVYLLLCEDPQSSQTGAARVYIGEGDEVATRLKKHSADKDWWDRVVIVTSQAEAHRLTKSQVRCLESQLLTRAKASGRALLDNGTDPGSAKLSEPEKSNMDLFLDQLDVLLPATGVDVFRNVAIPPAVTGAASSSSASPVFTLRGKKQGVEAKAQLTDGPFVVLTSSSEVGAIAISDHYSEGTARAYAGFEAIRSAMADNGVLVQDGAVLRFTKNTPLNSPSTPGSIALGSSCNGRTPWIDDSGRTFGAWDAHGIDMNGDEA